MNEQRSVMRQSRRKGLLAMAMAMAMAMAAFKHVTHVTHEAYTVTGGVTYVAS